MQPGPREQQKNPQKILPKMHEMSMYIKEMVMELEYPRKGATLVDWEDFHKQQIQFAQYEFGKKVKVVDKCKPNVNCLRTN